MRKVYDKIKNYFAPKNNGLGGKAKDETDAPGNPSYFKQFMYNRPNQRKIRKLRRQTGNHKKRR